MHAYSGFDCLMLVSYVLLSYEIGVSLLPLSIILCETQNIIMRMTFEKHLAFLIATTHDAITDRDRLLKHRKGVPDPEIDKANRILERHLNNTRDICRIVDAVYAMGRAIEDRSGMIRKSTINSTSQRGENRRIGKMHKRIKEGG